MDVIAVHAGAGFQSEANKAAYLSLCGEACRAGTKILKESGNVVEAVTQAVIVLENSPLTNAGIGSNLCIDGSVECDASLMASHNMQWAAVGALPGFKNPILVAQRLLEKQDLELPCGLIPPNLMVGQGAHNWALQEGLSSSHDLKTEKSQRVHEKYKRRLETSERHEHVPKSTRLDTVGVVVVSRLGDTSSGISSGGIALKAPGRVGQAAMYGAGCWSEKNVTVTTSGVGEFITRTLLAKEISTAIAENLKLEDMEPSTSVIHSAFQSKFLDSSILSLTKVDKIAGLLALIRDPCSHAVEVVCTHNSPTMCFSYMSSDMSAPKNVFSNFTKTDNDRFTVKAYSVQSKAKS
ncbi:Threonine aspartase 1 [Halotydeus destructor]|nr:Threonine aspartase 1 [Halotydeus destructor]